MDFSIGEEEGAVVELTRKILGDLATNERLKAFEASGKPFDEEIWRALADASLLGIAIPAEHGGADLGFLALSLFLREIGRTVAPVPAYASLAAGGLPLARFGNDAQRGEWLAAIASGGKIVTAALVEPAASDPLLPLTRVEEVGGEYRLTGTKTLVPFGAQASLILVPARSDGGEIGVFALDPGADGVLVRPQNTSDRQPHALVELRAAPVARAGRLGDEEDGAAVLRWMSERATAARCMMQLGVIERALEITAAYSCERVQFDRPIGSFQAVHQRAADAYINVEAVRLSALEAVWRLSRELPASEHVAVAKFWASEGGQSAAYACQHLHGGIGIDVDYPLHRYFVWAIQIEHELGSAAHQLERLGRRIAASGLPAD